MTTPASLFDRTLVATAALIEATAGGARGAPVKRVQLFPLGKIQCRDGRTFNLPDAQAAAEVVATTRAYAGKMSLVIDYDHQTEFAAVPGVGGTARASGWIDPATLAVEADGIWGDVEWTPAAAAALEAREYRYISPMFFHDKAGRVVAIKGAALVNVPAIDALAAVAATAPSPAATTEQHNMDYSKIATALGLATTATEAEILAAIASLAGEDVGELAATAATALGLAATASLKDVLGAAATAAAKVPDPKAFVPMAAFLELQASVASFQADKVAATVDAAIAAGKLTPALKDWGLALCQADPKAFDAYVAGAVALSTETIATGKPPAFDGTAATLTETELSTASALGLSPDAFAKAKKEA